MARKKKYGKYDFVPFYLEHGSGENKNEKFIKNAETQTPITKKAERPPITTGISGFQSVSQNRVAMDDYHDRQMDALDLIRDGYGVTGTAMGPENRTMISQVRKNNEKKQRAEELEKNVGWKRTGNQTVFVTPFSPLPKPGQTYNLSGGQTFTNTGTRANAPGVFGISPSEYVQGMTAFDRYNDLQAKNLNTNVLDEKLTPEARRYLQENFSSQYASGRVPNFEEVMAEYQAADPMRKQQLWNGYQTFAQEFTDAEALTSDNQRQMQEAQEARDAALVLLGADAEKLAGGTAADYYGRFANTYRFGDMREEEIARDEKADALANKLSPEAGAFMSRFFPDHLDRNTLPTHEEVLLAMEQVGDEDRVQLWQGYSQYLPQMEEALKAHEEAARQSREMNAENPYNVGGILNISQEQLENWAANPLSHTTQEEQFDILRWGQLNPKDREIYETLRSVYGAEEANTFLNAMEGELNRRVTESQTGKAQQFAQEHGILASLAAPFERLAGAAKFGEIALQEALSGETADAYDLRRLNTRTADAAVGAVAQGIEESVGGFWGDALGFTYQTAMSLADMGVNMLAMGPAAGFTMGLGSASSTYNNVIDRGGTKEQANAMAAVAGISEMLFERFSIEGVLKIAKGGGLGSAVLNVARQMGVEASEEMATEIANQIGDYLIMGDLSTLEQQGFGEVAKEIGLAGLGGVMMGGMSGTTAQAYNAYQNRGNTQKPAEENKQATENDAADAQDAKSEAKTQEDEQEAGRKEKPAETPENANAEEWWAEDEEPEAENVGAYVEREVTGRKPKEQSQQDGALRDEEPEAENVGGRVERVVTGRRPQEKTEQDGVLRDEEPEAENVGGYAERTVTGKKPGNSFRVEREVTVRRNGIEQAMSVTGVEDVSNGNIFLSVNNADGETEIVSANDVEFSDPEQQELIQAGSGWLTKTDAKVVRNYLDSYDPAVSSPKEYAAAFESAYADGKAGLEYERMIQLDVRAMKHLDPAARLKAFAAGMNEYNRATAPKETTRANAGVKRSYTTDAWRLLSKEERRTAQANLNLADALGKKMNRTITVVDKVYDNNGKEVNAKYNRETGEILISLNADANAYAYVAAHELTHALKNEQGSQWQEFSDYVLDALVVADEDVDALIREQMDRYGLDADAALEEVVCNAVPAMLQDEGNLMKLYKENRTLFERVVDWVREFVDVIKATGEKMAKGNADWKQMDALKGQREMMQGVLDKMTEIMNGEAETKENHSAMESGMAASEKRENFVKDKYFDRKMDHLDELKQGGYTVVGEIIKGSPLNAVGIPDGKLYFDNSKIITETEKHGDHINGETLKQIPEMLSNPIVITQPSVKNTVNVYGEMEFKGTPIVVGVMIAKNRTGTASIAKVRTIHARKDVLKQITDEKILYLSENKKETKAWFQARDNDVPLGGKRYGFIRSIDLFEEAVNDKFSRKAMDSEGNELSEEQQAYFENSKIRDGNGQLKIMYHGTANDFTIFNPMLQGGKNGVAEGYGIYFTDTASITDTYGGKRLSGYLNITNPASSTKKTIKANALAKLIEATCEAEAEKFVADGEYNTKAAALKDTWVSNYEYTYDSPMSAIYRKVANSIIAGEDSDMGIIQEVMAGTAVRDYESAYQFYDILRETMGIDGFITEWDNAEIPGGKAMIALAFNSNQFKNLDNETPTMDPDIRYSRKGLDPEVDEITEETGKALEQVRHAHRITAAEADTLAGKILKEANSTYDRTEAANEIAQIFDYVERAETVDMDHVDQMQTDLMNRIMEKSQVLDVEHEEKVEPLRKYFKGVHIKLTNAQRAEAAGISGSYNAYRQSMFGRIKLSSVHGTPLDVAWQDLHEIMPEWFPEDMNEGDMPAALMEIADMLKPSYHTGMLQEETNSWMAGRLNEFYLSLPAVKAAAKSANSLAMSVGELRKAMRRYAEVTGDEFGEALKAMEVSRRKQKDDSDREAWVELRRQWDEWKAKDAEAREERFQLELNFEKGKLRSHDLAIRKVYMQVVQKSYERQRTIDNANRRERELRNKQRGRTEAFARTMMNWLDKPTDAKHVPAGMEEPLRNVLKALDFGGKDTKTATQLAQRIDALALAVENAQEHEDENRTIFLERDQQMIDELRRVAELVRGNTDGRGVYDLNGNELKELNKWLGAVRHVITQASKMHGSNLPSDVQEVAAMSILELSRKKPMKDKKWITKQWEKHFGPDMLDSFTFFERLGQTPKMVFDGLRKGFDKMTRLTAEAEKYTQNLLKDVDLKTITGRKAKKRTFELGEEAPRTIEMTRGEIMELYVLSRREQARGHIYNGGIRIRGDEDAHAVYLTEQDVAKITGTLSEQERKIAEGLQKYLSENCAAWGNEASLQLLGYEKFGEKNYWPIATDADTRNTLKLDDTFVANIAAIKNQGITKALIEGASNTIMIGDIFDTYARHIANMAAYSAYAVPLSDMQRWLNSKGVKTEIRHVMGAKGIEYIQNFLMAINGTAKQADATGLGKMAKTAARNAKLASVGGNVRVIVQQPTSFARAAMYISPKYLLKAIGKSGDAELVNQYCQIAQWKRFGFYETNIGPNLRQMIVGDQTVGNRIREAAMKPAEWGDNWTLNHLWTACELETKDLYPELDVNSKAFNQKVGERMSEIVDRTQVVDSPFHRSQMMRSKGWMEQTLTNFMSEPTKTYNMLMGAVYEYAENRKNPAAKARMGRAFGVWAATTVLTAAAAGIVDAFRDDDEEKDWLEKYGDAVLGNALDGLNPLGMLPGVKDVLSLVQGYEPSRLDQQSIQRIVWAAEEIQKYAAGTSKQNLYGVSYKVAQALSTVTGIPVSNAMRDVNAIVQTVTGGSPTLNEKAKKDVTIGKLFKAYEEGSKKEVEKIRVKLREEVGMNPREIDEAVAEKLSADKRIEDAWNAKKEGRIGDVNRQKNSLTAEGFTGEMVDKAIAKYGSRIEPKEKKEKDPNEQLSAQLYSYSDTMSAIRAGASIEDVKLMMSELQADSTAADPEKTVRSNLQSELKKDYLAAFKKGDKAGMQKAKNVLTQAIGTAEETIAGWELDQYADDMRAAIDADDSKAAAKAVTALRKAGKADSDIKSRLSKYKQIYIEAMKSGNKAKAMQIKRMLKGLGLKDKKGKDLYTEQTFADWMK